MKKSVKGTVLAIALSAICANAVADSNSCPPLDKVSYQLSVDQWATSTTAKVTVSINATLEDAQLNTINSTIMANLEKIAGNVEWHITQFDRSKNQSGLEQLYAQAEARIPENALSDLRKNAKNISKPGAEYSIDAIDFSPSAAEIEKVKEDLRAQVYAKVQAELQRLDNVYPNEKFHLHSIDFSGSSPEPMPMRATTMLVAGANAAPATAMAVSNKVEVDARVVLASPPQA